MFQQTIDNLKNAGLTGPDDIVIWCQDAPSQAAYFWGGAIGAAIANSGRKFYIMSANQNEIRIFDIDRKTGAYTGAFAPIAHNEIKQARVSNFLGTYTIMFKFFQGRQSYSSQNKIRGFRQKAELAKLKDFFKANFK